MNTDQRIASMDKKLSVIMGEVKKEQGPDEVWKDIEGYEGAYRVSSFGRIKSLKRPYNRNEKILTPVRHSAGYLKIILIILNDKRKNAYIHRLVAQAFIPNPESKPFINHINGDTTDNRVDNLEWCTNGENLRHAYLKLGRTARKKLSWEKAALIRELAATCSTAELSDRFGVKASTISGIVLNRSWKDKNYKR